MIKSVSSFFAVFELFVNSFKNGSKNAILVGYHLGDRQPTIYVATNNLAQWDTLFSIIRTKHLEKMA